MLERLIAVIAAVCTLTFGNFTSRFSLDSFLRYAKETVQEETQPPEPPAGNETFDRAAAVSKAVRYIKANAKFGVGGEWALIALSLGGDRSFDRSYLDAVASHAASTLSSGERAPSGALNVHKATENARVVLGILAAGGDPGNVGGFDLVSALEDTDWVCQGTLNNPIFALIALNSCGGAESAKNALVDHILKKELSGGGWALSGKNPDADVTAMALQALSAHRDRSDVSLAASRAISRLSAMQLENGGYRSYGRVNSESVSQVIIALCAWGIDPSSDKRFVKDRSAVEALLSFRSADGAFSDAEDKTPNLMATEQAVFALAAYDRFLSGGGLVYYFR